ncbi:MBL fold metallo-hydrolase [Microbacterium sp. LWO13-1.2]|uniref:MBL fold metallo-hydrolase n=1 Tax=Microbacterium sp. LWO13-1.2 TaxID=3135262 RepID=UPI00313917F4
MTTTFTLVGGPTGILELAGLRIIIDPTFDEPRTFTGPGTEGTRGITKTEGPAIPVDEIGRIDIALVSHDQHIDNLDESGRVLLQGIENVFTTDVGSGRLGGGAVGLDHYKSAAIELPEGGELTITGVPAHHGPDGVRQNAGPVTGFVLQAEGVPTVYVSGDNSDLEVVAEIARRFPAIDVAVLFAGGAKFEELGGAYLTLSNEAAVEAAKLMPAAIVVPVHADGWAHFSQTAQGLVELFAAEGMPQRIVAPSPGHTVTLPV